MKLTRDDFRALASASPEARAKAQEPPPPVPDLYPVLAAPPPPALTANKLVTISITDNLPLKDVLFELARQAQVDVELDPAIQGGVTFSATNRPFLEVIDRISKLAGLRYRAEHNAVRIEVDSPYVVDYAVPFINQTRDTTAHNEISNRVVSPSGSGGGGGGNDSYSSSEIASKAGNDFYGELDSALQNMLLASQQTYSGQASLLATRVSAGAAPAKPVSINRMTGIVSVAATERQHKLIAGYIDKVRRAANAQVVIEAKVIEVTLNQQYSSGINWNLLAGQFTIANNTVTSTLPVLPNVTSITLAGKDLNGVLKLIEQFGTTRTLSSPRLTVLNNQMAVLKVARNEVFFELKAERQEGQETAILSRLNVTSTIHTVPIGLTMTVQPSINDATRQIALTLRPTITRVVDQKSDPAIPIVTGDTSGDIQSLIPVVEVREVDSVMQLQSGQVGLMGGLMQNTTTKQDQGLPQVSGLPVLGALFKARDEQGTLSELVVLLKADIARNPQGDSADRRLYDGYTPDPRPVTF